jgi:hypothetical protein
MPGRFEDFSVEQDSDFPQTSISGDQDIAVTQPIGRELATYPS